MSPNSNDGLSSPRSLSRSPQPGARTSASSASTNTSPGTVASQEQRRRNLGIGPIPATPNDRRKGPRNDNRHDKPPANTGGKDWLETDAQSKYYQKKIDDQAEKYQSKIKELERIIARLEINKINPEYVAGIETDNEGLWTANEALQKQVETLKVDNRKLNHSNAWQQREIDHIRQECMSNGAAIQSIAVDQQSEFNSQITGLKKQLHATQEENAELYESCTTLQQENDNLKTGGNGSALAISRRLKLIDLPKDMPLEKEELVTINVELERLGDQLNANIKNRMSQDAATLLGMEGRNAQRFMIEQSNETIRRYEVRIEELEVTVRRQEDQMEDMVNERQFARTPNLESELDDTQNETVMLRHGEPGESELKGKQSIAGITDESFVEQVWSRFRSGPSKRKKQNSNKPKSEARWFGSFFSGLFDEFDEKSENLVQPLGSKHQLIRRGLSTNGLRIQVSPLEDPSSSLRLWMEMISMGRTYYINVATRNRNEWVKVSGPRWWSLIIQLLSFILICTLFMAYWSIMEASAERELWLDANEITMKKYWDTSVWGAERGILWRLHYGLGIV